MRNRHAIRVYSYRCHAPLDGIAAAQAEMRRQIMFWNDLVAIENAHKARLRAAAGAADQQIAELLAALDAANETISSLTTAHQDGGETGDITSQLEAARTQRRHLQSDLGSRYRAWRRAHRERVKALEQQRQADVKAARQATPAFWGNYNRVRQDFDKARKQADKTGGQLKPRDPDDLRRGILTVQIMQTRSGKGAAPEELFTGQFPKLVFAPISDHANKTQLSRGPRARATRTTVTMRVDAAGATITLPVIFHRLLPDTGRVKLAQLVWRPVGEHTEWYLNLTMAMPNPEPAPGNRDVAGLDLGWRQEADGSLRIASLCDSAGHETSYRLPADWMQAMDHVDTLQREIDQDAQTLIQWARGQALAALPDPLRRHRELSPSSRRRLDLAALHDVVQAHRDAPWPDALLTWYLAYRRKRQEQTGLRWRLQRRRREIYRLIASDLASTYRVIAIDRLDLANLARTRTSRKDKVLAHRIRRNRWRAALHLFREALIAQASKHGAEVIEAAGNTTAMCHHCGATTTPTDPGRLEWTCQACGAVWDQDRNAAANLVMIAGSAAAHAGQRADTS